MTEIEPEAGCPGEAGKREGPTGDEQENEACRAGAEHEQAV